MVTIEERQAEILRKEADIERKCVLYSETAEKRDYHRRCAEALEARANELESKSVRRLEK